MNYACETSKRAIAMNRRDTDAWSRTWGGDGVWEFSDNRIEGRENIVSFWQDTMSAFPIVFHTHLCGLVDLQDDTGRCRWYIHELVVDASNTEKRFLGVYHDTC